jgi:hypothetical protein
MTMYAILTADQITATGTARELWPNVSQPSTGPRADWLAETIAADRSPAATNFLAGQSMKLAVFGDFTVTWPVDEWMSQTDGEAGVAPKASAAGWLHVELWREGSTFYGAFAGYSAS